MRSTATSRMTQKKTKKDLLPIQRQNLIKDFLVETGFVSIADLSEEFSVSEMTIRRDLDELESQGFIQRTYGGAVSSEPTFFEMSFQAKSPQYGEEKRRIGRAAAEIIKSEDTIILDSGTTTDQIIRNLKTLPTAIISNALNVVSEAMKYPEIEVFVAGGMLRSGLNYTIGPQTSAFMETVRADILFLAVEGVDTRAGFTVPDLYNADNKRAMARAAQKVIAVTDHSKLGRVSTSSIFALEQADLLITGKEASDECVAELREHIDVLLV
ncbi:MAG: DeoR/GlpR family DNA-binding transcription regulator [Chloroflexota bacterium]|nr:DeoR/GlpR family DNA-binding transcription regulator [Chloroflexota bacterium]